MNKGARETPSKYLCLCKTGQDRMNLTWHHTKFSYPQLEFMNREFDLRGVKQ